MASASLSEPVVISCIQCSGDLGTDGFVLPCLHSICAQCINDGHAKKTYRCVQCQSHSTYPVVPHFLQPGEPVPILACASCVKLAKFERYASFYCMSCSSRLCAMCKLNEHKSCYVVDFFCKCPWHPEVPWSAYCTVCHCAVCFYRPGDDKVHLDLGHKIVYCLDPFPELRKDLDELATVGKKMSDTFQSFFDKSIKSCYQFPMPVAATNLQRHCREILTLLKLSVQSNDERRLLWLKKRTRMQVKILQRRFEKLSPEITKLALHYSNWNQRSSNVVHWSSAPDYNYYNAQQSFCSCCNVYQTQNPSNFLTQLPIPPSLVPNFPSCNYLTDPYYSQSGYFPQTWNQIASSVTSTPVPPMSFLDLDKKEIDELPELFLTSNELDVDGNQDFPSNKKVTKQIDSSRSTPKLVIDENSVEKTE